MKVIKPVTVSDAMILASNATEAYAAWSSVTTYSKDQKVDYGSHYYNSLVNTNTNNIPDVVGSTFWEQIGPDNKHAMFDGQVATETTKATSPLTVTIETGIVNSVAMIGLTGSSVTITVRDNGASPPVYTRTVGLDGTIINDWYMYFFEPFVQLGEVVLTDLPPYANAEVTMSLSGGGAVAIGELIFGTVYTLGAEGTEQGATVGIIDYSRKDTDPDTGVTTFTRRAFSKRMTGQFLVANNQINGVQRILADIRAVPSVFIGSELTDYAPLVVYGFYRDFSIDIAYPTKSWCRLEVEGLI
jgi:archaellum component FlaF (FlaF/FlaG flagellin family)